MMKNCKIGQQQDIFDEGESGEMFQKQNKGMCFSSRMKRPQRIRWCKIGKKQGSFNEGELA